MDKETVTRAFGDLKNEYERWVPKWKEQRDFIAPTRGSFFGEKRDETSQKINHKRIYDQTAWAACKILSSGLMSGLTSPSRSWFSFGLKRLDVFPGSVTAKWLLDCKKKLENIYNASGLYKTLEGFYDEAATFGTGAFLIEPDYEQVLRFTPLTIGEYMVDTDDKGNPNRFGRLFGQTVSQLEEKFGFDALPPTVQTDFKNKNFSKEITVYHFIAANQKRIYGKADRYNMPFISVYWLDGMGGQFLRVGGYEEFPVIEMPWETKNNTQAYGDGPGAFCLGDVKMLQKLQYDKLFGLEMSVRPPMQVNAQVQGEVSLFPGGLTRYNGTVDGGLKPVFQVGINLRDLEATIESTRQQIRAMFNADMFLMLAAVDTGKMTATEVMERQQEKMLMLGPLYQRLKDKLLDPLLTRSFNICLRSGVFGEAPEELAGQEINVEYISMIAQAQKAGAVSVINQGISAAGQLAQFDPTVLDNVDFDGAFKETMESLGMPATALRAPDEVQALRALRAQQQAQQQQAQQAMAAVQGAKTLSEMKLGQGTALDVLAGIPERQTESVA